MPIIFDPLTGEMMNLPLASSTKDGLLSSSGAVKLESAVLGYIGFYATPSALTTAHPTGTDGQFASIGTTDTFWIWDSDTNAWKDSGTASVVTWASLSGKPTTIVLMKSGTVDDAGVITLSDETEVADLPITGFVVFTAANTAQGVAIGDIYQKKLQSTVIGEETVTDNIVQFLPVGKEATAMKAGLLSAAGFTKLGTLSAFEPSSEFWVDSNFEGEVSDGTINKPFKTFSAAVAAITSDCAIHIAPGTYTEASSVAMPAYACSIYGNRASLSITGNFTVYIGFEMRGLSLNVSGVFSSARCYYENCDITAGSIVSIGQMRINFCQVNGDITVNATKGFDANLSEITGRIIANGDSCRIVDCVIQCNSASPAIYSTAGYLIVMGAVIYNTGGGGDISCNNGATTLPNIITNVYCYTGGIVCGDAVTVTNGSVTVATTFTGTAIRSGKTLMALGSDTTGDIYCRGSDGFLTRIASPETGKFLGGNGVGVVPTFKSIPEATSSGQTIITSGGLARWTLANSLSDSFGSYTLTNTGLTFSTDSSFPLGSRYVAVATGTEYASFSDTGLPSGASAKTYSAWIKTSATTRAIIMTYGTPGQYKNLDLEITSGGYIGYADGDTIYPTSKVISDGSWHHVALVCDGTVAYKIYVDGIYISTPASSAIVNVILEQGKIARALIDPTVPDDPPLYFSGSISDARIYNRSLTPDEILSIYTGETGTPGLITAAGFTKLTALAPASAYSPTKIYHVDGNRTDTYTADGSIVFPFKTIGAATAVSVSGTELKVVPGTYTENVILPDGVSISGFSSNKTIISGTLTTTASTNIAIRNIQCSGTVTFNAPVFVTGCYFTGAVVVNNVVTQIYDTFIICGTAGVVPITVNGSSAKYQHFLSTISATGDTKCVILNDGTAIFDVCQFTNAGTSVPVIEALDGQLVILNSWIVNNGGGAAVSADNGATTTLPNAIGNVFVVGSCAFGSANTVIEGIRSLYGTLTLTGTALLYRGAAQISVDASGFAGNLSAADTDVQKALETLDATALVAEFTQLSDTAVAGPSDGQQLIYKDTAEVPASGLLINFPLTSSTPTTSQSVTNSGVTFASDTEADRNVAVFNGSSYLSFPEASMPTGNPTLTIFGYVKIGSGMGTADGVIFGYGKNDSAVNCLSGLLIATTYFGFHPHGGGGAGFTTPYTFDVDGWYAVCATRNGTSAKLYVDGVQIASGSYDTANLTQNDGCNVGRYVFQDAAFFNGKISKLLVYNRALSDSEIVGLSASVKNELKIINTDPVVSISAQTASYTLVLTDKSKLVTMSNSSANVLTIPLNSGVAFPVGTWIDISCIGAGTCTITAASGVTLNGVDGGTKELVQWAGARLYKITENTWITR